MKKVFFVLLALSICFVVCFGGYRGYRIWQQKHLIRQAREFLAKPDVPNALLCLRKAINSNPSNLEACRMMAEISELARSQQAVFWRNRLVSLEPHSLENRLALARTAVGAGDLALAQRALDSIDAEGKKTAGFHKIAGAVATSARQYSLAEQHFSEAARLEPDNPVSAFNLAMLGLHKTNEQAAAQARGTLQALCTNAGVRCDALRQLTMDALRHKNMEGALGFSGELIKVTNSTFNDRLLYLEILRVSSNAQLKPFLAGLQKDSAGNPHKAYEIAKWMMVTDKPDMALAWIQTLPPATRTNLPVPVIEADCYVAARNWTLLQTNLAAQNWADLNCLRRAYRTLTYKAMGMQSSAKAEWAEALKDTDNRLERLNQLLNTVTTWKWVQEQEDVLWIIYNRYPHETWAFRALSMNLYGADKTQGLLSLYRRAVELNPKDINAKNNLAMFALLLKAWECKPHEVAREAYDNAPTNSAFASTYAFSLHVQKKYAEALKVLEQLPPKELENPSIAGYYGMVLKAVGNSSQAAKYFSLASKARLLPEERKLIEAAATGSF